MLQRRIAQLENQLYKAGTATPYKTKQIAAPTMSLPSIQPMPYGSDQRFVNPSPHLPPQEYHWQQVDDAHLNRAAISTIEDARAFYDNMVQLCMSGMSRHAALIRLGKDRKAFVRIEPICQLMITQPDVFKMVHNEWLVSSRRGLQALAEMCKAHVNPELVSQYKLKLQLI